MERMLHLLETFRAHGSDGKNYVVHGYEHLARLDGARGLETQWEPTGEAEYRLADGRHISVDAHGAMSVPGIGLSLLREGGAERSSVPAVAPSADALVTCDVCLREVPRSEAIVPEATDYVAYFCGLECFEKWKNPPP
ncbi:MAG TPA: DUF3330 domain-containing protein [Burkholderiaceae bacterium]|nr:DUF3330 domain-containing protein [Burkholderiaceae bacterium]